MKPMDMDVVSSDFAFFVSFAVKLAGQYYLVLSVIKAHVLSMSFREVEPFFAESSPYIVYSVSTVEEVEALSLALLELLVCPPRVGEDDHFAYFFLDSVFVQGLKVGRN